MKDELRPSSFFIPHLSSFLVVALLFLAARIALLFTRQPFFDELFTVWMARQPLTSVVPNLLHDSGPPLYYWLARFDSVRALRWMSLTFAALQFGLIAFWTGDLHRRGAEGAEDAQRRSAPPLRLCGESSVRLLAASLLAVYPPAVLFAVDSRAYALCALFVTAGVLALGAERPFVAAAAFVAAAYSHYYGVLFFPVILTGVDPNVRSWKTRIAAFFAACVVFIPGFILASRQPSKALGWNREPIFAPLLNLSWMGTYPESLFAAAPLIAAIVATLLLAIAVSRSWRFAPAVIVPLVLVLVLHVAGRPVYFPMRFESVIAGPLVLWVASSLAAAPRRLLPHVIAGALMFLGAISVSMAIRSHSRRPLDPYRNAALVLRDHASPRTRVVATGFCYLETVVALGRPVTAWPAEQAIHPGWRAQVAGEARDLPQQAFLWIGERQSPEVARLRQARHLQPLFINERAVIARVEGLTAPLH